MKKGNKKPPEPIPEEKRRKSGRNIFQEYSEAFVVAVILAILIRAFLIQAFKIPSRSMVPTLIVGDHILVCKFIYGVRIPFTNLRWPVLTSPKRGDVIVFVYPEDRTKDFIKRVVGIGGDTVEVVDKVVYVNGKEVRDDRVIHSSNRILPGDDHPRDNFGPVIVPKDHLFVMGDNRDESHDSRFWDASNRFVPVKDVKGEAFLIYYSGLRLHAIRFNRMFKVIH